MCKMWFNEHLKSGDMEEKGIVPFNTPKIFTICTIKVNYSV